AIRYLRKRLLARSDDALVVSHELFQTWTLVGRLRGDHDRLARHELRESEWKLHGRVRCGSKLEHGRRGRGLVQLGGLLVHGSRRHHSLWNEWHHRCPQWRRLLRVGSAQQRGRNELPRAYGCQREPAYLQRVRDPAEPTRSAAGARLRLSYRT